MHLPAVRGYLGLGSNEGDRLGALRSALVEIARRGVAVVAASSVYETAPQGEVEDQADFLNACVAVEASPDPEALLVLCKDVERELGREPRPRRHGPRPIDVDVLLLGEIEHRSERLVLPHPQLGARRFVLEPLLELEPELALPDGTRLAPALAGVADQRVTRVGPL